MTASPKFPSIPKHWTTQEKTIANELFIRIWSNNESAQSPKKILVVIHGQGEQSDRYTHFAHYLDKVVDVIAAVDLPGHGKSAGVRGHISSFSDYHKALSKIMNHLHEVFGKSASYYLLGHSMGGQVALGFLDQVADHGLKKAIICAPLLDLGFPPPPLKVLAAKLVAPILPSLKQGNELNIADLTHDESVNSSYRQNPLNHSYVTPRWFIEMQKEAARLRSIEKLITPTLWIIPLADKIVSAPAALKTAKNLQKTSEVRIEMFPGMYHEAFNELGKEQVFNLLANYLQN